ncbi:glycosyltransferase family 9 protein [Alterinioella nitratireducens]|uniref:glycosyltransferase family 9 protein n=1 Tax=Rhodobacterales TaxID=204455 RepID=UPI0040580567
MNSMNIAADLPCDFALLMNVRPDKGFDLVLKVAALCPSVPFVAVASQSGRKEALDAVVKAGLRNFTIIEHTDRTDLLYAQARVVLVPSYRFLETFSRVCIEAHRYGKPVIGSDCGNVPRLLEVSGTVLPEAPSAWAKRLQELYNNEDSYSSAVTAAFQNSSLYSKAGQSLAFDRIVESVRASTLIGVGSGIGNMLHAGPMIRNIAQRTGRPVDLVVSQDHSESLFLLQRAGWVNEVHTLHAPILNRHYKTVFLTHSFGSARIPFSCDQLIRSRDWANFEPGTSQHETMFNLEASRALLGIDYDPDDIEAHYVGEIDYVWSDGPVVGLHGGSKPGYWASKRWPGFAELTAQLKSQGFRVVSFGTPEELVEGAEDRTGGTIEEMVRDMRMCSWFVSNDSGVMNLANAIGIPVLSIFGPTEAATRKPFAARNAVVAVERDCAPCEVKDKARFKEGRCDCIAQIEVEDVLAAFDDMRARMFATHAS